MRAEVVLYAVRRLQLMFAFKFHVMLSRNMKEVHVQYLGGAFSMLFRKEHEKAAALAEL